MLSGPSEHDKRRAGGVDFAAMLAPARLGSRRLSMRFALAFALAVGLADLAWAQSEPAPTTPRPARPRAAVPT